MQGLFEATRMCSASPLESTMSRTVQRACRWTGVRSAQRVIPSPSSQFALTAKVSACLSKRPFSCTVAPRNWLIPKRGHSDKNMKGRPRVPTGGSTRGTTVVWGDYGIRLFDHDRRIPSKQLQIAMDTLRRRLKGESYRIYTRIAANIGVYTSGNEQRMGKGKGSFDYWAARVAVSQIIFEVKTNCHEQVIRDALRLVGNKLPGKYEFVKKGDPPVMGITKMREGMTMADMKRPVRIPVEVRTASEDK